MFRSRVVVSWTDGRNAEQENSLTGTKDGLEALSTASGSRRRQGMEILPIIGPSIDFGPALPAAKSQLQLSSCLVVLGVTRNSCSCPPKPAGP